MQPKLNTKRTIYVGFAFFLICAFWQAYDNIVPLMLVNKFGMNQTLSGLIMALDNIFALFMLPLFGSLSDKTDTKLGKRTPYIIIGTIVAIVSFVSLSFVDNFQLVKIFEHGITDQNLAGLTPEQIKQIASDTWAVTAANPLPLVFFIILLLITLVSMSVFRSPAVALMPDVTVKPLRSKGNAIINLMGTAGGILVLVLGMVFGTSKKSYMEYTWYIIAVCAIMAIGLVIFLLKVREKKWNEEMLAEQAELDKEFPEPVEEENGEKLSKGKLGSLLLILASVALWFMGYNAVTSKFSVYATNVLQGDFNLALTIAQAAAIVAYIPVGIIAGKFGRKNTILMGVALLAVAFGSASFMTDKSPKVILFILFALAGIAWATINVNSFPMVVELAKGSNIGKYTGYYYTASMAAQVITPILSGFLMDSFSMKVLFPYAAIFVALSFVTMLFVKFGNAQDLGGKTAKELISDNFSADND